MSGWWFTAPIDGINAIGELIVNLPSAILSVLIQLVVAVLYPMTFLVWILQQLYTLLYNTFVPIINVNIAIANIPLVLFQIFFAIPTPWKVILQMSIMLSLGIRLYRWSREFRGWMPFIWGSGDGN